MDVGDELTLRIEKVVDGGQGLSFHEGKAVFVPYVLPGELVTARVEDSRAKFSLTSLVAVLEPSEYRIEPSCPLFGRCGGCQWLHVSYQMQLEMKRAVLTENLQRIGRLQAQVPDCSVIMAQKRMGYRTSVRLHMDETGHPGYYMPGTHDVVPQTGCPLHEPKIDVGVAWATKGLMGVDRMVFKSGDEGEVVADLTSTWHRDPPDGVSGFPCDGLFFNHRHVGGVQWVTRKVGGVTFRVFPHTFFQIHSEMTEKLHQEVRRLLTGSDGVLLADLYAGTGAMGMGLTDLFNEVVGFELDAKTVRDAKQTCKLNEITNYKLVENTSLAGLQSMKKKGTKPTAVILDPPRRGCEKEVLEALAELTPGIIVYISCNPATLARDVAHLVSKGFSCAEITMLDLFPQTYHIESIVCLKPTQP